MNVKSSHTISWSIQPHKKSLNFGIFKHPGHSALPTSDSQSTDSTENLPSSTVTGGRHNSSNNNLSVIEKLTAIGLKQIKWVGKCEADKIAQGTYDVPQNEGGNYALVFDNTFSKQLSKTVTLVLLTYPTAVPPKSGLAPPANHANSQPFHDGGSTESLRPMSRRRGNSNARPPTAQNGDAVAPSTVHRGLLHKRRRKRHQGWARRFFALDFSSSTLSYYHDPNSATLRGSIPLHLAAVACNEKTREISVDSGAEIWHLRASNDQEFVEWKRALEKASSKSPTEDDKHPQGDVLLRVPSQRAAAPATSAAEDREWIQVEKLVGRVSASRDTVRQLAKDTDPKYHGTSSTLAPVPAERPRGRSPSPSPSQSPAEVNNGDYSGGQSRQFWKRKTSGGSTNPSVRRS